MGGLKNGWRRRSFSIMFTHRAQEPGPALGPGGRSSMRLLTAHKILIGSAVVFFVFFGFWELANDARGEGWAAWRGALYLIVALGFGVYLRNLKRWYK